MAWLTVHDIEEHLPVDLIDANGMSILRAVSAFDPDTGEVESHVLEPTMDGRIFIEDQDEQGNYLGQTKRRREFYPAPLIWKRITHADVERLLLKGYWDQHGR